jgi:hypothetical protein
MPSHPSHFIGILSGKNRSDGNRAAGPFEQYRVWDEQVINNSLVVHKMGSQ